jgi:hypothetical protein
MKAGVFTQNKPPRPARPAPIFAGSKGPPAIEAEPYTYPPAARIPAPVASKHALSNKFDVSWQKAIRLGLASPHNNDTFCMEKLPLGRNANGNK